MKKNRNIQIECPDYHYDRWMCTGCKKSLTIGFLSMRTDAPTKDELLDSKTICSSVLCIKTFICALIVVSTDICTKKRDGIPLAATVAVGQNVISKIHTQGDTIAMDYCASYKNSKDPSLLRKELVSYAISYGNKKAAQQFQTTVKTVRKWRKRREEKKGRTQRPV